MLVWWQVVLDYLTSEFQVSVDSRVRFSSLTSGMYASGGVVPISSLQFSIFSPEKFLISNFESALPSSRSNNPTLQKKTQHIISFFSLMKCVENPTQIRGCKYTVLVYTLLLNTLDSFCFEHCCISLFANEIFEGLLIAVSSGCIRHVQLLGMKKEIIPSGTFFVELLGACETP